MPIDRLDHVNVQTHDLDATRDFYVDVIGLRVGARPPFTLAGYWLYDDSVPVVHLIGLSDGDPHQTGSGAIDHIAFRAAGLAEMRDRLTRARVPFSERVVPRNGELQIFLSDPNGVRIELTYTAAEAALQPGVEREPFATR